MPDVEIRPFSDEHLDAAAQLLADRHRRHLAAEPLLARGVDYRMQVEAEQAQGDGAVALVHGEVSAYLVARVTDVDAVVGFAGCAARDPELVRDLYASLSPGWGRDRHRAYVPASDAAFVDAWFRLAFGLQFTLAVRIGARERRRRPARTPGRPRGRGGSRARVHGAPPDAA